MIVSAMEAKALYHFDATEDDELSFRKGDVLKVCHYGCFSLLPEGVHSMFGITHLEYHIARNIWRVDRF